MEGAHSRIKKIEIWRSDESFIYENAFFLRGTTLLTVLPEKSSGLNSESANKLVSSSFPANPEDDLISRLQTSIYFELSSLTTRILNSTVAPRSPRFPARPGVPSLP